mgnify:CR=1 FL=1
MESIEVVDEMISLVEQQFSEVKPQDYEETIEELGAKLNVLAIQCGLRNEDNLPYKPGTLTWNDFQFGLKFFTSIKLCFHILTFVLLFSNLHMVYYSSFCH